MPRLVQVAQRATDFAATAFYAAPEGSTVGLVEQRPH